MSAQAALGFDAEQRAIVEDVREYAIDIREHSGVRRTALYRCPACDAALNRDRWPDYVDAEDARLHLEREHGPEDFGLSPLGGRS